MARDFEIEFNESVFCTELNTGKKHCGNFHFDGNGITTTLISFDGHFFVKPDDPVFLLTEKLAVISPCDSFNARFRDVFLNGEILYSLREAQILIEKWRKHYNTKRPHSALGYRPPAPETIVQMDQRPIMH